MCRRESDVSHIISIITLTLFNVESTCILFEKKTKAVLTTFKRIKCDDGLYHLKPFAKGKISSTSHYLNIAVDDCHEFHSLDLNHIYSRLELFNVLTSSHSWYITFEDFFSTAHKLNHDNDNRVLKYHFTI